MKSPIPRNPSKVLYTTQIQVYYLNKCLHAIFSIIKEPLDLPIEADKSLLFAIHKWLKGMLLIIMAIGTGLDLTHDPKAHSVTAPCGLHQ